MKESWAKTLVGVLIAVVIALLSYIFITAITDNKDDHSAFDDKLNTSQSAIAQDKLLFQKIDDRLSRIEDKLGIKHESILQAANTR